MRKASWIIKTKCKTTHSEMKWVFPENAVEFESTSKIQSANRDLAFDWKIMTNAR